MENVACKGSFSISDKLFQKYLTISEKIANSYNYKSTKECSRLVGDIRFSFLLNKQLHLSKEFRNLKCVYVKQCLAKLSISYTGGKKAAP